MEKNRRSIAARAIFQKQKSDEGKKKQKKYINGIQVGA
jgi:hypothetical protein